MYFSINFFLLVAFSINLKQFKCDQEEDNNISTNKNDNLNDFINIKNLLHKLESYAISENNSSDIVVDDLKAAYYEYQNRTDLEKWNQIEKDEPLVKLLVHILLKPMEDNPELKSYDDQLVDSKTKFHQDYIKRLNIFYKRFRPCYLGVKQSNVLTHAKKLRTLLDCYDGKKELSKKILFDAKKELQIFKRKIDEILIYEDIFGLAEEYEGILNTLNFIKVRVNEIFIFPLIGDNLEEVDVDLESIKNIFFKKFEEYPKVNVEEFLKIRRF